MNNLSIQQPVPHDALRSGVERAVVAFGRGFLAHERNHALRARLQDGSLPARAYLRELLCLVYRLLFLFVAEDRGLLLDPRAGDSAREWYQEHHGTRHLRDLATPGAANYGRLRATLALLEAGSEEHGIRPQGCFLWSPEALACLRECDLGDDFLQEAVEGLVWAEQGDGGLAAFDSEALGGVHEALLELQPQVDPEAREFRLSSQGERERKATGSFYTPSGLVRCLLDAALDPLLDEARRDAEPERAILSLKLCDPSCGSGHFLVAAARRMAGCLVEVRGAAGGGQEALRDVIARCIYGVDLDVLAVELCKINLWMEMGVAGLPLGFLEHRILCGNSILGATPAAIAAGIPDRAFQGEGPRERLAALRKQNRREREVRDEPTLWGSRPGRACPPRLRADAWCAAFAWDHEAWPRRAITTHDLGPSPSCHVGAGPASWPAGLAEEVGRLARRHEFFHWHLAFPDVFRVPPPGVAPETPETGWSGGFDLVLGNPPYLRDSRKKELPVGLLAQYRSATSHYDIYVLFMELGLEIVRPGGRMAMVTSHGFLRQKYGAALRRLLLAHRLEMLLEIDYMAFRAGVKTCITSVRRQSPAPGDEVRLARVESSRELDDLVSSGRGWMEKPLAWLKEQETFAICAAVAPGSHGGMRNTKDVIPLQEIALVSLGMVFHDPRPGGKKKKDYLSPQRMEPFTTALVDGEHVERWGSNGCAWLHYCPDEHREPRFRELFASPKMLCRRIIGRQRPMAMVDEASLFFSDNVVGVVLLHELQAATARILVGRTQDQYERSRGFSPWFLACLVNSRVFEEHARQVLGVGLHLYPAHLRQMPVPCVSLVEQEPLVQLARQAQEAYRSQAGATGRLEAIQAEIEERVARMFLPAASG